MTSRLGQRLLRAESKAENFGLFALHRSYFFYLMFGCPMANFWMLSSKQSHSSMLITEFGLLFFDPKLEFEGVGSLHLTDCPVSFHHNAITPQIAENTLPRLKPSFSKMWKCPQYPKQV